MHKSLKKSFYSRGADHLCDWSIKPAMVLLGILCVADVGTCLGLDRSICSQGSEIAYYATGQLKACTLENDREFNGVRCKQAALAEFHENGLLKSAITCNQFSQVSFYATGRLYSCDLANQITIDGKVCAQLKPIFLFENGKLKSCSLPD